MAQEIAKQQADSQLIQRKIASLVVAKAIRDKRRRRGGTPVRPTNLLSAVQSTKQAAAERRAAGSFSFQQTMQQRTIDKLRKKLTKERKRCSKIQEELKLCRWSPPGVAV